MPEDPGSKRKRPAPEHPEGFPAAEDVPVHVAPAVDVRPNARARAVLAPIEEGTSTPGEVPFTLPFPVEERSDRRAPLDEDEEPVTAMRGPAPISQPPQTVEWDRVSNRASGSVSDEITRVVQEAARLVEDYEEEPETRRVRSDSDYPTLVGPTPSEMPTLVAAPPVTIPRSPPVPTVDEAADVEERDALLRDLVAIGPLDERADRTVDRAVAQRTTLARARALRFRLSLLDAWITARDPAREPAEMSRSLHVDLVIDAMLMVAIADGAPSRTGPATPLPTVPVMVSTLRSIRPDLPRVALRDRGTAAIARLTILGWRGALEHIGKTALATPPEARKLALLLAARAALAPMIDDHRLGALQDLEKALALPPGSVAPAIEEARRR